MSSPVAHRPIANDSAGPKWRRGKNAKYRQQAWGQQRRERDFQRGHTSGYPRFERPPLATLRRAHFTELVPIQLDRDLSAVERERVHRTLIELDWIVDVNVQGGVLFCAVDRSKVHPDDRDYITTDVKEVIEEALDA